MSEMVNASFKAIVGVAVIAIATLYAVAGYENVEINESAIRVDMLGAERGTITELTPGMQWIDPFKYDVFAYNVRSEQYDIPNIDAETNDGQPIQVDVSLEISLVAKNIGELHKTIGRNWYDQVVYPAARKYIRINTSSVSSEEIYTDIGKRKVSDGITSDLASLEARGIKVVVNLRNISFTNPAFIAELENKAIAAQREITAKRNALAAIETAKGVENTAEGAKQARIKAAEAQREELRLEGEGQRIKQEEEAKGILAIARANAEGTRLQVNAYGDGKTYASVKWAENMGPNVKVWGVPTGAPGTASFMDLNGMVSGAFKGATAQ